MPLEVYIWGLPTYSKWSGGLCPRILRKIVVEEKYVASYLPIQCNLMMFEINGLHIGDHHKIDLVRREVVLAENGILQASLVSMLFVPFGLRNIMCLIMLTTTASLRHT